MNSKKFKKKQKKLISLQRTLYGMRNNDQSHDEYIFTALKPNKTDAEFTSLVQMVFGHHEISDFRSVPSGDLDWQNPLSISKHFHGHYYLPVTLHQGTSHTNPDLTRKEFLDTLRSARWGQGTNNVCFLVGGIGAGKTTFLCNMIYSEYTQLVHSKKIPIRVNLDVEEDHSVKPLSETLKIIQNTIITQLELNRILGGEAIKSLERECRITDDFSTKEIDSTLGHLFEVLKARHEIEIVLVIDNIDFLYHLGDRGFFSTEIHEDQRTAYAAIIDLINFFWRKKGEYKCANLGLNLLFTVRGDTLEFIRSRQQEVPITGIESRIFCLSPAEKDVAQEVVKSRFNLLSETAGSVAEDGKKSEFLKSTALLSRAYQEPSRAGQILFDDLWRLCRRGLRDIIDQMADYSWLEFHDERRSSATLRFATQYYPSMIAYGTDGRRRYSQFLGNLPNLFLINAAVPNNEFAVDHNFKAAHPFTYWLKWLMLSAIRARKDFVVSSDEIIQILSGGNRRAYPENLVRYVLGALTEVPASELVEVEVGADGDGGQTGFVRNMHLTERGEFLMANFCCKFSYFQMVIDDWRMLIPNALLSEFGYLEPDYSYLVAHDADYSENVTKTVQNRGIQAIKFSLLVDEALNWEKQLYPNVFSRLEALGVEIPSNGYFFKNLREDVHRAGGFVGADLDPFDADAEWVSSFRDKCKKCLEELFQPMLESNEALYAS